jgi:hypothetical protein
MNDYILRADKMQKKAQHCRIRIDEEDDGDTGRI